MTEHKHTPGPWFLQEPDFLCDKGSLLNLTCESRAAKSFSKSAQVNIADIHIGFDEPFESEQLANARLIKAAPDMLALLYMALPYVEEGEQFNKPHNRGKNSKAIRDLISEIEGQNHA